MGRKPIGKRAMTPAQRQRRRRKKLRANLSSELRRLERNKRRAEALKEWLPVPPGITYWRTVQVERGGEILQPITRPLAVCQRELDDDEVLALIRQLHFIAKQRGIEIPEFEFSAWEGGGVSVNLDPITR